MVRSPRTRPRQRSRRRRGGCTPRKEGRRSMRLFSDSIGRKVVMAVTGMLMVLFIVGHLLGNLTVFIGPNALNTYADKLHSLGALLWIVRVVMIAAVVLHIVVAIQITLENSAAKPERYAVQRSLKATFASKNMIW